MSKKSMVSGALLSAAVLLGSALLGGCSIAPTRYVASGTPASPVEATKAQCDYEASLATASYGSLPPLREHADKVIGHAVGEGVVAGMRQADLIKECMHLHGYVAAR